MGLEAREVGIKLETLKRALNRAKKDDELVLITTDNKAVKIEGKMIPYNEIPIAVLKKLAKAQE